MSFLIFDTENEAITRSEDAGKVINLGYHLGDPIGCRYVWAFQTEDADSPRSALIIKSHDHLLNAAETAALVDELPADWIHPPNPFE